MNCSLPSLSLYHVCCRSLYSTRASRFRSLVSTIHSILLSYVLIIGLVITNVEVKFILSHPHSAIHHYFRCGTRQCSEPKCSAIVLHFATLPCPRTRRSSCLQLDQWYGTYAAVYVSLTKELGHVSGNGHAFPCKNPAQMQRAFNMYVAFRNERSVANTFLVFSLSTCKL